MSEYATIRTILRPFIGKRVLDISQHDEADYDPETGKGAFVMLLFEDGHYLKFWIDDDGFEHSMDEAEEGEA